MKKGKNLAKKDVPILSLMLQKYRWTEEAENVVTISRVHGEKYKKRIVKMFLGCRVTAV
jgi:hypothetical protein